MMRVDILRLFERGNQITLDGNEDIKYFADLLFTFFHLLERVDV